MDEINLVDYIRILRRRWRTIAGVTLAALVVCLLVLRIVPPTYRAEAVLIFPSQKESSLASQLSLLTNMPLSIGGEYGSSPSLYTVILKSRTINERVLSESGLPSGEVTYRRLRERLAVQLSKDGSLTVSAEVPTSWMNGVSGAQREQETAKMASRVANLYVTTLQDFDQENSLMQGKSNREFIEGELAKTKDELSRAEVRLQRFREQNPTVAPPDSVSKEFEQILELKTKQFEAESGLREVLHRVDSLRTAMDAESETITSSEVITQNPVVSSFKLRLAELEVSRETMLEKFTADHPEVVDLDEQISKARDRIQQEIARLVSSETRAVNPVRQQVQEQLITAEVAKSGMEAREMALSTLMERAEQRLAAQPVMQVRQMRLLRDLKALEALYSTLLAEHGKSRIAESKDFKGFTVLDWAETPKKRSKPNVKLSVLVAVVIGVMSGTMLALAQESLYRGTPKGQAQMRNSSDE